MRYFKLILLVFILGSYFESFSQCAMCKSALESNIEAANMSESKEKPSGIGINEGILYLMAMPYLAMMTFGIFWYFQKRKRKTPNQTTPAT